MDEEKKRAEEKYRIGKQVLTEDDLTKVITIGDGDSFTVRLPNPAIQERIEREIALRLGGNSLDSIPAISYNMIRMCVTLDFIIEKSPDWWKTAGECYDEDILSKLWEGYLKAREEFRRSLREGRFKRNSP